MIREPFAEGRSWVHRIHPRYRVLAAAAFTVVVAVSYGTATLAVAVVLSLLMAAAARLDVRQVAARLAGPALFLVLLWLVLPWSYEGPPLADVGPVTVTRPGVALCVQITLKTTALLLTFMALLATMTVDTLGHTLSRFGLPDKLVYMLLITYRYLFVLEQEYRRLARAIKIRGFQPGTNLHSYRTYAYLVGMIFVRASERARRVHSAMICRGFCGRFVSLRQYPPTSQNGAFAAATGIVVIVLVWLEWFR